MSVDFNFHLNMQGEARIGEYVYGPKYRDAVVQDVQMCEMRQVHVSQYHSDILAL
jgi:hypothetical protein